MNAQARYALRNPVRIVTAASLFDGHDAAINIMRRILQSSGAEIIHLGHNRSVAEVVECAIQEDAQAIAMTSYQGGHVEYLKYMYDMLEKRGAKIKIFAGGGGTILPTEIAELHSYGIARVYSPDDGRVLGLQGMINDLLQTSDFEAHTDSDLPSLLPVTPQAAEEQIAALITIAENYPQHRAQIRAGTTSSLSAPVLGITGTGGAGKSSLVDELIRRFLRDHPDKRIAILSIDPSKRKTGGALLGDRIRMNSVHNSRCYMRSLATRQAHLAMSGVVPEAISICRAAGFDLIIVETSGIGQSDTAITDVADTTLYVMTSEYGAATQLEKIDMLDFADIIAINKFDKRGSLDAIRDVRKQYQRNHQVFVEDTSSLPIYGTIASQFNDPGTNQLYLAVMKELSQQHPALHSTLQFPTEVKEKRAVIPPERSRYLAEIAECAQNVDSQTHENVDIARKLYQLAGVIAQLRESTLETPPAAAIPHSELDHGPSVDLVRRYNNLRDTLPHEARASLESWPKLQQIYQADAFHYTVRGRSFEQPLWRTTLSENKVPRVALPAYKDWGDILHWLQTENVPGSWPFTAGVFPLKRAGEDPARMFAGEGGPERTNRRFHYVSRGLPAKRLSTAFDSVTLYGEDPHRRPDIYGKVGNSGVSIATVDDAKKLYSGFDLCDPKTSVSMTINGPAPMLLGFLFNAAIDQQCEKYIRANNMVEEVQQRIDTIYRNKGLERPRYQGSLPEGNDGLGLLLLGVSGDEVLEKATYEKLRHQALSSVRGTVQADILKEDQAQNTCIFSTEFALRMMGDIQEFFTTNEVKNFYSVSISGYHIAEAGANPITQLAFTLANGFTFVEYYLSRGMCIDDFAPNLSFFFSNGMDPEYAVLGRVARRIWAKVLRYKYHANTRSQKLKYHIQTSGRSLHASEIAFNDIRTTLQALYALNDNCNSLHTNAYDEAITTPTEESVRRALAIQLVINKELGLSMNENPVQGAFIMNYLTDMVERAVLLEFRKLSDRGGVLGAMERMYQRSKIQDESLTYEHKKLSGELPIIGVNTFLDSEGSPTRIPDTVIRATVEERDYAIKSGETFRRRNLRDCSRALIALEKAALANQNTFESLMEATKVCTLGQISECLYRVGGQYRRNM